MEPSVTEKLAEGDRQGAELGSAAARWELAAILAGLLLGAIAFAMLFGDRDVDFEELALDGTTVPDRPQVGGAPIHCEGFPLAEDLTSGKTVEDVDDCLDGDRARGFESTVLWLGNSQIHAINQYKKGDTTAVPAIFDTLAAQEIGFLTVSYPNANQQEHLAVYAYSKSRVPLTAVVLSLVFDDFRESGVRARLDDALLDSEAQAVLNGSALGQQLIAEVSRDAASTGSDLQTLQDRSEATLESWFSARSDLWAQRPQARGGIFEALYRTRNALFGINPQSIRKMIPGSYASNMAAVEAILLDAERSGIRVLGYIAPLRDDVPAPYAPQEYKKFVREMQALFESHGGVFENLETLVPAEYWGAKGSTGLGEDVELDFMHFQGQGHALLAHELAALIQREVLR